MPWLAINAAPLPSNALTALWPTSGVPDAAYSAQRISPPQVHRELVDGSGNRLMRDGEHGGPHGMAVDHAADVVERAVAREVQCHLRRRGPAVLGVQHATVRVDDDEVVEHHV